MSAYWPRVASWYGGGACSLEGVVSCASLLDSCSGVASDKVTALVAGLRFVGFEVRDGLTSELDSASLVCENPKARLGSTLCWVVGIFRSDSKAFAASLAARLAHQPDANPHAP